MKKQAAKLDGMDALKMEKAAMKKRMEKMDIVSMEREIFRLKECVEDVVEYNAKLKKSVKEYRKENADLTVDLSAAEAWNKVLAGKVEKLEIEV